MNENRLSEPGHVPVPRYATTRFAHLNQSLAIAQNP